MTPTDASDPLDVPEFGSIPTLRQVENAELWSMEHLGSRRFRFTNVSQEEVRAVLLESADHPAANLQSPPGKIPAGQSFEVKIQAPTLQVRISWHTPSMPSLDCFKSLR